MRGQSFSCAVVVAASMVSLGAAALVSAQDGHRHGEARVDAADAVASLGWLSGTWSGEQWGGTFTAHYSTPSDGKILSYSRLFRDGEMAYFEFEVFEASGEGVTMSPFPGGKKADGFTMSVNDPGARKIVFENREKDYPTRITYERADDRTLLITLDDPHGESGKREEFRLARR